MMGTSMRGEKWVDLGNAVVARLEVKGSRFEILVDPDKALNFDGIDHESPVHRLGRFTVD